MNKHILSLILVALLSVFTLSVFADEAVTFNVGLFKANAEDAKRAAYKALLLKKWRIKEAKDSYIISTYGEYESKIDLASYPEIRISYINTSDEESYPPKYLITLKKNIQMSLVDCGRP